MQNLNERWTKAESDLVYEHFKETILSKKSAPLEECRILSKSEYFIFFIQQLFRISLTELTNRDAKAIQDKVRTYVRQIIRLEKKE